ncbi:ABC transporter ATP-binding protein [Pilimelia columellifera]|uniref:ABC transporter ATP-binding protein n=1 Tax=Pilimelia columellifera TaxID=706574 RepID=UPI0031CDCFC0
MSGRPPGVGRWGWLGLLTLCGLVDGAARLTLPAVLGRSVDALTTHGRAGPLLVTAAGLVAAVVAAELTEIIVTGTVVADRTSRLRRRLVRHILAVGPQGAAKFPTGDLVSRVSVGAADAARAGPAAVDVAVAVLPPVGSVVLLAAIDLWLGVAFLAGVLLVGLVLVTFTRRSTEVLSAYQRVQGEIAGRLAEALAGSRTIAAAGTRRREQRRVIAPLPELHRQGRQTWRMLSRAAAHTALLGPLTQLAVLATAGLALAQGRITAGELFAASQYALLGAGLGGVAAQLAVLARTRAGAARTAEVRAVPPVSYGRRRLSAGPGAVELRDVSARVAGRDVLHPLSLSIPAGGCLAVVGPSGAGKSTLLAIVARLREPETGSVLLDGVPVEQLTSHALRSAVGCAFDRPVLVGTTVSDALGPGLPSDQVRASATATQAHEFVSRLPRGYATPLVEAPLSGGEAQRLGLARAWHAERLLLLDDATSSLDMITEHRVEQALQRGARTRIVVTHRAGTAARADRVLWLDGGRVRGLDSHRNLWSDPQYRAVFT